MTVKFTAVEKSNPQNRNQKKFYATIRSSGDITFSRIEGRIMAMTALSHKDVKGLLEVLIRVIIEEIRAGNIIRFDEFGSFFLTLTSIGTPTADELTQYAIQEARLHFRPGKRLKNELRNLQYEKIK